MNDTKFGQRGKNIDIYQPVTLIKPEKIFLGDHIIISEFAYINGGLGTHIGNHIHIAAHSCISGGGYCIIEDFVGISAGAKIITGSAQFNVEGLTSPTLPFKYQAVKRSYVVIKKHAFLATNVIIHPGVIIGEGSVIASGSIVTKDTEPWSFYMGSPARKTKNRNRDMIIELEFKVNEEQNLTPSDFTQIIDSIIGE